MTAQLSDGRHRVVVTGTGIVSPIGGNVSEFHRSLRGGTSGIGRITLFDVSTFPVRIGGEVKGLDACAVEAVFPSVRGERDRKVWLGLTAACEATRDSGISDGGFDEASLHVGAGLEEFQLADAAWLIAPSGGDAGRPSGHAALQTPLDRVGEILGSAYGFRGGRWTNTSACAAGSQVVGEAFRRLQHGISEVAVAGACDSMLNPLGLGGFSLLRVLSDENDRPRTACRPFDSTRKGTVLGEGAAFLVLETLEHALRRGARIHAEVIGYGSSMDAFRVSDPEPSGRGAVLAMRKAIRDAGISAEEVDCVNAHATGTPKNDVVETAAIKEVLGEHAYRIPVHAVKSMTGHMIAASGAAEAVAAVLTLDEGFVPATINLEKADRECDLDCVPGKAREFKGRTVLSNSFGFGGQNAALVFSKYPY